MNLVNKDTFNKIFELIEQTIEVETINYMFGVQVQKELERHSLT